MAANTTEIFGVLPLLMYNKWLKENIYQYNCYFMLYVYCSMLSEFLISN